MRLCEKGFRFSGDRVGDQPPAGGQVVEARVDNLPPGGRLVANAVTAESEALLVQSYSRFGGQLRRLQHYQGEPLGGFTGWRPQMPVTQWAVTR